MGVCTCYSSHIWRPSHCPIQLNEQRRSPRRYVYPTIGKPYYKVHFKVGEYTPMDIYRCLIPDWIENLRSLQMSRTKRQVNAFIIYMIPTIGTLLVSISFPPIGGLLLLPATVLWVLDRVYACKNNKKLRYIKFKKKKIKDNKWLFCLFLASTP